MLGENRNRWVELKNAEIPSRKNFGFESNVLSRDVWNQKGSMGEVFVEEGSLFSNDFSEKDEYIAEKTYHSTNVIHCTTNSGNSDSEEKKVLVNNSIVAESLDETVKYSYEDSVPYLIRKSNDEYININKEEFIVGKGNRADCVIEGNDNISRMHVKFIEVEGNYFIEDLNSLNHTYLNNNIVTGRLSVKDGDTIKLANEEFVFNC